MTSTTYAYYPGCSLHSSAREYDVSARLVCRALGIELRELEGWTCCGASSAHLTDPSLALALPARELYLAGEAGLPLAVACAMCFARLKLAAQELSEGPARTRAEGLLGHKLRRNGKVIHLLEILEGEAPSAHLVRPLLGLRVACYYGCLLVRPEAIALDDAERPTMMDRLVRTLGAEPVEWAFKTECCGASFALSQPEVVLRLSHHLLRQGRNAGADCLAVACPMCQSNLDTYQRAMKANYGDDFEIPVLYFSQLFGLALGFSPKELLLRRHFTSPMPMLAQRGLI